MHSHDSTPAPEHAAAPHALPPAVLLGTWATLLVLTALTVTAARMDLGHLNVVIALAIAAVKASIVALFFMHLKYENKFHLVVLVGSLFFALVLASFVVFDTTHYQPDIRAHETTAKAR